MKLKLSAVTLRPCIQAFARLLRHRDPASYEVFHTVPVESSPSFAVELVGCQMKAPSASNCFLRTAVEAMKR